MKVLNSEGPTNHADPESCVAVREGRVEALTGEGASRVLSREIHALVRKPEVFRGADAVEIRGRQHRRRRIGETLRDLARSETPYAHRNILHGSREISRLPRWRGRIGKLKGTSR
mgnify:CR=1 FL=1